MITDLNLPDGKGTEFAEYVHSMQAGFPVLFLSGSYSDETLIQLEKFDPVACLLKRGDPEHYQKSTNLSASLGLRNF